MEIENQRVLVTGSSRGLGRALVAAFIEAGAREVLAGARKPADLEALKSDRVTPVQLDVTNDADVNAVVGLGAIDFEKVQEDLAVNYLGVLRVTRAVAPGMIAREDGMIVNIATAFAKINLPLVGTYSATKAALLSLGQAFRAYLLDHNVRVITVMPTTIDTDMSRGANVPKLTKEFVAAEILDAIREEKHDPPIGDEAKGVFEKLAKDPVAFEKVLQDYRMKQD